MRRILLSPSWWLRHVLAIVLIGIFLKLGWWQWEKGRSSRGTIQNLFYGLEWPFFAGCVIFGWWKMISDELAPPAAEADTPASTVEAPVRGAAVAPADDRGPDDAEHDHLDDDDEEDEELAAYNRYLADLNARDKQGQKR